ncbi:FAD-dependent monooxygenase [Rufibacter hautae]|uniref:NAD(P)-binding protein n=1 Tax=Rufibacter hautae TaxID=2595005 RepID=A0A5B6TGN6_9BACT|nr:FAD-dependent monooxygenase [Rufibacter hautae]KAA3438414.1 NAD(P)-binding protein [Rufibacter hautae]
MKIGIIGGGIAGLTTAIALQRLGLTTHVFDAAPRFEPVGAGLALAANAIKGFQRIGIAEEVIAEGNCLDGFHIFDEHGRLINRTDSRRISEKYGLDNFVIHRASLHRVLVNQLPGHNLHPNKRALSTTSTPTGITVHFQDGKQETFDHLLVSDGINSAIRKQLLPQSVTRYAGYTCWRAIIGNPGLDSIYASETWGKAGRVGWTPLKGNKIYWFACINARENDPNMKAMRVEDLQRHFQHYHAPIPALFRHTKSEELLWHDLHDLAPLPQFAFQNVLLLGDAGHATTPNMGQGACQAVEDAIVFADELKKDFDFNLAAKRFEARRMPRTHWITRQSRFLGEVAQSENQLYIKARNFALRHLPTWINDKQLEKIYSVDF